VIPEEMSIFLEVIGHGEKEVYRNICLILNAYLDLSPLDFCLWGWMKSEVYKREVDTRDALIAGILDVAARIKKIEDQLR
jgi:hypothetical protein